DWEPALCEEIFDTAFRPTRTVNRKFVDADEKRGSDQEVSSGIQHLIDIFSRAVWPKQMLENLFRNNQVERFGQSAVADVKSAICERLVLTNPAPFAPGVSRYLQYAEVRGPQCFDHFSGFPIHHDAHPLLIRGAKKRVCCADYMTAQRPQEPVTWN